MRASEKDRLAAEVADRRVDFETALSGKHKYPVQQFREFWEAGRRYAELTKSDQLIHRSVVDAVNGLTDFIVAERKRVPERIVRDAQRLELLIFQGYDSYFRSFEPPASCGMSDICSVGILCIGVVSGLLSYDGQSGAPRGRPEVGLWEIRPDWERKTPQDETDPDSDLNHAISRRLLLNLKARSFLPVLVPRLRPAESLADALLGTGWRGIPL
jgi:hypothetical protein